MERVKFVHAHDIRLNTASNVSSTSVSRPDKQVSISTDAENTSTLYSMTKSTAIITNKKSTQTDSAVVNDSINSTSNVTPINNTSYNEPKKEFSMSYAKTGTHAQRYL